MPNEGCEYCKYEGFSEPLINKENVIEVCSGDNILSVLGIDVAVYQPDESDGAYLSITHEGFSGDCISDENVKINFCPMCGRKL